MRTPLNAALLVLLLGYASSLSAAQAESNLTSFAFQLEDLDINDGVTPSLNNTFPLTISGVLWDRGPAFDLINVSDYHDNSSVDLGFARAHASSDGGASFASAG